MKILEKWKNAVIHLECATGSQSWRDILRLQNKQIEKSKKGQMSEDDLIGINTRDKRFTGTAIFLEHDSRYYLITARHVLYDQTEAAREIKDELDSIKSWPENMQYDLLVSAYQRAENKIYSIIFRVPSLDELKQQVKPDFLRKHLMNLGAGVTWMHPYSFTKPEIDLAIISLNQRADEFTKELIKIGKKPIKITDIESEPTSEGTEIFTVGFPAATANLRELNLDQATSNWASNIVSLPTFAFGRVAMLHESLNFFWADMSIYPGNSGGPVIENSKLVGIVSSQPGLKVEANGESLRELKLEYRIPFGRIIKAKYIKELLDIQIKKDQHSPINKERKQTRA